jgi:NHLM bacteriocin system ABC transporter peptidase/ATP-binding protein
LIGSKWIHRRIKTPSVLQMEAAECGAACLSMILEFYGRYVPLEELRVECGVSRDGSKASNIVRAARKYGLEAKGFRKNLDNLEGLTFPVIIFWDFNHFVVLEDISDKWIYLNDPASGPRRVTLDEFDKSFTGVVLTFEPGPEFTKGGQRHTLFPALRRRFRGASRALTYVVLVGLLLVIPGLVIPTFSRVFVDDILVGGMSGWLAPLMLAMGVTALLRGVLTGLQNYYLLRFQTKLALTNSAIFFRHVLRLPVEFFVQRYGGEIGSRIQLNDKVARLLSGELSTTVLNLILIVFFAALMLQYDVLLTALGVVTAILNLAALRYISKKRKIYNQRLQLEGGKLLGVSMGGLQMIETLKATGSESDFFSQWSGHYAKVINAQQAMGRASLFLNVFPTLMVSLNSLAVLGFGGLLVMEGRLSMGMLVAFQSLMASFMGPVRQMINVGGSLQEVQTDTNRLDDVLNYKLAPWFETAGIEPGAIVKANPDPGSFDKLSGQVDICDLTFGYSKLSPALITDFSLSLKPGSRVALVGNSGSGKSTIAKLVSGLYQPWQGDIQFDGVSLLDVPRSVFNASVAMVDQQIFVFEGSVRDNICMWNDVIPESDIYQAARDAGIHSDIVSRAGGYDGLVQEGGRNFSGGQLQRLEIARALVNNPSILVLDEATSALDPTMEKTIDDNLRRRGCACLIVAHRLSTIRDCDEIIVMQQGEVVQRGTHDELISQEGLYADQINAS